ncbi:MAG TPA: STAS domain-containing protein [Solirubrobacteraceae bacterium]
MRVPGAAPFSPDFAVVVTAPEAGRPAVIEVRGELDSGSCEQLLEVVRGQVGADAGSLTLDLRQTTFIDSAGMRALIVIERLAKDHGASLTVVPPREEVTELLRIAGLADRMQLDAPAPPAASRLIERTELELARDPNSPARARVEVREALKGGDQSEVANIVLLTSELVTNAVVHPRGVGNTPMSLRLTVYCDRIRVEVEDCGEGFDRVAPVLPEGERGRGLFLVDRFSERWGRERVQTEAGPRFRVWFETGWRQTEANAAAG